ncbi:MAG: acetoacetate--CoA ligase [Deltaproteobacteria bacterium]|nr:acetoacetate--CoA ligase [Deltaproteobacteria bacterium]
MEKGTFSASTNEILWQPPEGAAAKANVSLLMERISQRCGKNWPDYQSFRDWSADNLDLFWSELWSFCGVIASHPYGTVLKDGSAMPGAIWFDGARLNFAENLLRYNDDLPAIVAWSEEGPTARLTYAELRTEVERCAAGLSRLNLEPGDRVAGLLPNIPEAVVAMLACTSLGLVWSSCSPEFSAQGVLDRFSQIAPKIFFTVPDYLYQGSQLSIADKVRAVSTGLPSLISTVLIPQRGSSAADLLDSIDTAILYDEFLSEAPLRSLEFKQLPASHPIYILYSSGTTGAPKCIVHGAAGILVEHLKELVLEVNLTRSDKIFYATSCGWMMWNWLVSSLAVGSTVILFDGYPLGNEGDILFDLCEREQVTVFGTSAGYLQKIEEMGKMPRKTHSLRALRSILSTGSRLKPHSFDFVYKAIGDIHLSPIWGGTDLCGCLGGASPLLPVRRDEIQSRGLGLDVDVVDSKGSSVREEAGEVVVKKPFPSMPLYFLNDPSGERYKAAYFEHFPGMWRHGDLAVLKSSGGMTVLGRSDDTLNPGGVRIGAAEVTAAAERVEGVIEAMAVAQKWGEDERILLFVILSAGTLLDESLKKRILDEMPSPRHRPKEIVAVPDFPTTLSGKRSAKAVRDVVNNQPLLNKEALANPQILQFFENIGERANNKRKVRKDNFSEV